MSRFAHEAWADTPVKTTIGAMLILAAGLACYWVMLP